MRGVWVAGQDVLDKTQGFGGVPIVESVHGMIDFFGDVEGGLNLIAFMKKN